MKLKFIFLLLTILVLISAGDAQRRKKKNRNRNRSDCHLREVEKCLDNMQTLNKQQNPTVIFTTNEGIDKFCGTVRKGFIECVNAFFKKCGTPLHREVGGLFVDQVAAQLNKFCSPAEREKFLQASPCIHEKVWSQDKVKADCNNRYIAALDKASKSKLNDSGEIVCCGYRFWQSCSLNIINKECGSEGKDAFNHLISHAFLSFPDLTCPADLFVPNSSHCKPLIPKKSASAKVKLDFGDTGLSKYNVANLFPFMFTGTNQ